MSPLTEAVAGMHELYLSLVEGGFTDGQACRILGAMLATAAGGAG